MEKKKIKLLESYGIIPIFLLAMIAAGCAGANSGMVRLSGEVNDLFESSQVLDKYQYYFSGAESRPDAILGIDKMYTLRTSLWKPVDLTPSQLGQWVDFMTDHRGFSIRTYGAEILGPNGEQIGIWYSPWSWTTVRMESGNEVVVYTPSGEPFTPRMGFVFRGKKDW